MYQFVLLVFVAGQLFVSEILSRITNDLSNHEKVVSRQAQEDLLDVSFYPNEGTKASQSHQKDQTLVLDPQWAWRIPVRLGRL